MTDNRTAEQLERDQARNVALMTELELAVLAAMYAMSAGSEWGDGTYFHFSAIERATGLTREFVRAACRRATDRGLATYARGLVNDDGECCGGAGYSLTGLGVQLVERNRPSLRGLGCG
jgi:hypothetical protein